MGKNSFVARMQLEKKVIFNEGIQMGRQQILDMMSIVLNDPDIMGKNVFGKDRLIKIIKSIGEYIDVFQMAWEWDAETDYYRAKLDDQLSKIYGEELHDTFGKRYELCPEFDYRTGKMKRWGKK